MATDPMMDPEILLARGRRYYRQKEYQKAWKLMERALQLKPGDAEIGQGMKIVERAMRRAGMTPVGEEPASSTGPIPVGDGFASAEGDPVSGRCQGSPRPGGADESQVPVISAVVPHSMGSPEASPADSGLAATDGMDSASAAPAEDPFLAELQAWQAGSGGKGGGSRGRSSRRVAGGGILEVLLSSSEAPAGIQYITAFNMLGALSGMLLTLIATFSSGLLQGHNFIVFGLVFLAFQFYWSVFLGLAQLTTSSSGPMPSSVANNSPGIVGALFLMAVFAWQFYIFHRLRAGSRKAYLGISWVMGVSFLLAIPANYKLTKLLLALVDLGLKWPLLLYAAFLAQLTFTVIYLATSSQAREYFQEQAIQD